MRKALIIVFTIISLTLYASDRILNISVSNTDLTLNPFYTYTATEAQYLNGIYEGLVTYNPKDLSPEPALAESWTLSEDKTEYTFKIRKGLTFNNGEEITAETFRNTFIKLLSPDTKAEFSSLLDIILNAQEFRTGKITDSSEVGIKTDGTDKLIIKLKKRAPYFTKILCHHSFTPVPESLLNKKVWETGDQLSSGAYILDREGDNIILQKNEKYWDSQNVYYDRINIIKYDDLDKSTKDFNSGKVDWMTEGTINLNSISNFETLKVNPLFGTTYYYFNPTYKEYKDKEIRKAISLLIPWNKIRENQYIPANSLIPSLTNFPKNLKEEEQNIEEALNILEKKGFPKGKGLSDIIVSVPDGTYADNLISLLIKQSVEENTEVKVVINKTKYPDYFTINRSQPFTISTLSWIGDFADPLTFLEMWTSNSNLNDSGYSSKEYDELIENSSNLSKQERYKELSAAEKILLDSYIVVPISHSPGINVIDTRFIENWYPNTLNIHPYKHLRETSVHVTPGLI